jgi:hypothetical protein
MLVQGMNYLLDIKQDLFLTLNGGAIASINHQSALNFHLFSYNKSPLLCKERL